MRLAKIAAAFTCHPIRQPGQTRTANSICRLGRRQRRNDEHTQDGSLACDRPFHYGNLPQFAKAGYAADLEIDYQQRLCAGLLINRHLKNGTEVDCVSDTHAIEVDFTDKWAEAIGQSLQYSSELRGLPGIILICRANDNPSLCLKHRYLIEQTMSYWRVGMTLWLCDSEAAARADCTHEEIAAQVTTASATPPRSAMRRSVRGISS